MANNWLRTCLQNELQGQIVWQINKNNDIQKENRACTYLRCLPLKEILIALWQYACAFRFINSGCALLSSFKITAFTLQLVLLCDLFCFCRCFFPTKLPDFDLLRYFESLENYLWRRTIQAYSRLISTLLFFLTSLFLSVMKRAYQTCKSHNFKMVPISDTFTPNG